MLLAEKIQGVRRKKTYAVSENRISYFLRRRSASANRATAIDEPRRRTREEDRQKGVGSRYGVLRPR